MSVAKLFRENFETEYIEELYKTNIQYTAKPGIDRVNVKSFNKNLEEYCDIISRKVNNGIYKFIPYKEILINKGRNKSPRIISLPSIRDRIVLSISKDIIHEQFSDLLFNEYVKKMISRVSEEYNSKKYTAFIKIDMKDFYGSLDHSILIRKLWKKARKPEFIHLITSAITNPTISQYEKKSCVSISEVGVPQGLPISNILADIYMIDFDNKHRNSKRYAYFRYVDDILILCMKSDVDFIYTTIKNELTLDLKLNPHPLGEDNQKTHSGSIRKGFSYLGYRYEKNIISVNKKSRHKIERAIESLFNENKNTNITFNAFLWKLNLKITGAVYNQKSYGWLFYYSQINYETLMFELDSFVAKMFGRYNLRKKLNRSEFELKRFVRTYKEIRLNKLHSTYFPRFDIMNIDEKRDILKICNVNIKNINDEEEIILAFDRFISASMKELERDRGSIS